MSDPIDPAILEVQAPVLQAMIEYARAVRGNWSDIEGRELRPVIDGWVRELRQPDPSHDIEWHRRDLGICMAGGGHWCGRWGYCDATCGCVPCAADALEAGQS